MKSHRVIGTITSAVTLCVLLTASASGAVTAQEKCNRARLKAWRVYLNCVEHVLGSQVYLFASVYERTAKCRHKYFGNWEKFQTQASLVDTSCIGARYADNGDQTVTDRLSGLTWEKKNDGGAVHDKDNTHTWSMAGSFKENGTVFTSFLDFTNGAGGFGGSSGWRLPTIVELQTIMLDFDCKGPALSANCTCPSSPCVDFVLDPRNTVPSSYWSSTSFASYPHTAYTVNFGDGSVGGGGKNEPGYVRAVRGGL